MNLTSDFVTASDGTRIHYRLCEAGNATTACVLVHGSGEGGYVWNQLCPELAAVCPTVAIDLRGHGDSDSSRSSPYDVATHTNDVESVIERLKFPRVILIGHSLGGQIASRLAAKKSHSNLSGLILVDICPDPNPEASKYVGRMLREALRCYGSRSDYKEWLLKSRPLLSSCIADNIANNALRLGPHGFELKLDPATLEKSGNEDGETRSEDWNRLGAISCPTLVIRGMASAVVSASSANRMIQLLPDGYLATVQGAGHAVASDNPQGFLQVVLDFIKRILRQSTNSRAI